MIIQILNIYTNNIKNIWILLHATIDGKAIFEGESGNINKFDLFILPDVLFLLLHSDLFCISLSKTYFIYNYEYFFNGNKFHILV